MLPPCDHATQPIAAIMKPIPAINLILIFWNPLWYFVYDMVAHGTSQAPVFVVPV